MSIEDQIKKHIETIQAMHALEELIRESLEEGLWDNFVRKQLEVASQKATLQTDIKKAGNTVQVDGFKFGVSTRSRDKVNLTALLTECERAGDLQILLDTGVLTYKANPDQIDRLPPELAAVYKGFVVNTPYKALTWPKNLK